MFGDRKISVLKYADDLVYVQKQVRGYKLDLMHCMNFAQLTV